RSLGHWDSCRSVRPATVSAGRPVNRRTRYRMEGRDVRADFSSQSYFRNPAAEIEKLRSAGPVVEVQFPIGGTVWTTTTQDLADRVLKDSDTFTLRRDDGSVAGMKWWMPRMLITLTNNMLAMDEPNHFRLRDIVDEAFRRRAILDME